MTDAELELLSLKVLSYGKIHRLVSLIENIHRKDLFMVERGRAVYDIFLAKGYTLNSKKLAKEIDRISDKKQRNIALKATEKLLLQSMIKY